MLIEKTSKSFVNGVVYLLHTEDGYPIETTDTFLPLYTKDAIGRKQNDLISHDLGSRDERYIIGVSTMSGCPVRCKFCLVPNTQITMGDFTTKSIENIKLGDDVLSNILTTASNESTSYASKYYKNNKVTELFKRWYSGNIIKVTLSNGNCIELTPNHRIATCNEIIYRNKYVRADELHVGDKVFSINTPLDTQLINSDEWIVGWLYGFIKGDAVYTKNTNKPSYKTSVSQSNTLIEYAYTMVNRYFGKTTKISEYHDGIESHKTAYRFSFGESTYNNMMNIIDTYSNNINFKKGFLAGFWDAEGFSFKNNKTLRVCNTNIENLELFNSYLYDIGFDKGRINQYKSLGNCLVLESNVSRFKFNRIVTPLHTKKQYLDSVSKVKNVCDPIEITSIESYTYDGYVYNFATETHSYIANDILVHNCATGTMKKCRNLTADEIVEQVLFILSKHPEIDPTKSKEFKINYTRMGEPFLNIENVRKAIETITEMYPNTHHYVSTIGIKNADYSWIKGNVTLQVSLHSLRDEKRNWLIPFKHKVTIEELGQIRTESNLKTTINMTLVEEDDFNLDDLKKYFDKEKFFVKLSPINKNCVSESNNMGNGAITAQNLI